MKKISEFRKGFKSGLSVHRHLAKNANGRLIHYLINARSWWSAYSKIREGEGPYQSNEVKREMKMILKRHKTWASNDLLLRFKYSSTADTPSSFCWTMKDYFSNELPF